MRLIYLKQLKKDAYIFHKYINDGEYMNKLYSTYRIIEALEIDDEVTFYKYQHVIPQLKGIGYFEARFLHRTENLDYFKMLKNVMPLVINKQDKQKDGECKIIRLKKGN